MHSRAMISEALQAKYDNYYEGGCCEDGDVTWREIGARQKAKNILSMCSQVPHAKCADIGAGEGAVSAELSRANFSADLHCFEISQSGVESIKKRRIPGVVRVEDFDGYHIAYGNDYFDLAICSHVLEHVEHERAFIQEVARVSKFVFFEVPLENTLKMPCKYEPNAMGHINFYSRKSARILLQTCGLDILQEKLFDVSFAANVYRSRIKGAVKYAVRHSLFMLSPMLATSLFTCHCGYLCAKK